MPYVLSLDEGTTSARAALYNESGERVAMQSVAFDCHYPRPGWVEQDALAVWESQTRATRAVLQQSGLRPHEIAACGITNQRETTVVWDRAPVSLSRLRSYGSVAARRISARSFPVPRTPA